MRAWVLRRMAGPVMVYLVVLSLLPTLGMGVLAGTGVRQARAEAATALRVEHAMRLLQTMDELRSALKLEGTSTIIARRAQVLGLSVETVNRMAGLQVIAAPAVAAAATDRLVRELAADADGRDAALRVRDQVAAFRRAEPAGVTDESDRRVAPSAASLTRMSVAVDGLSEAETDLGFDVVSGRFGNPRRALLPAVGQLSAATGVAVAGSRRAVALYALIGAASGPRSGPADALRQANAVYVSTAGAAGRRFTGELATGWSAFQASRFRTGFDVLVTRMQQGTGVGKDIDDRNALQILDILRTAIGFDNQLTELLRTAVTLGVQAARADGAAAGERARRAVLLSAATFGSTVLLLLIIGGALRQGLIRLGEGARRLSAGDLRQLPVAGPTEIRQTAAGLNDAVHNLRRVLDDAERLAAGDLTEAEPSRAGEGPLSVAVHAAFEQLADSIRERDRLQGQLAHQADHDLLTGLPNRGSAERLISSALEAVPEGRHAGVLFIDLDRFKQVNDGHGHAAGDHVLQVVSARMRSVLRPEDSLCRLGGDEFVAVLPAVPSEVEAVTLGARIVDAVSGPIWWNGLALEVGASVGVALSRSGADTIDTLLLRADQAVYRAKALGRNRVEV